MATETSRMTLDRTTLAQADAFLQTPHVEVPGLGEALDAMDHAHRLRWIRGLGRRQQAQLFESAVGRVMTIDDLVPPEAGELNEVICEGRNTLPAFRLFQKRFCRGEGVEGRLYGYNHQKMAPVTGPGYFVAYEEGDEVYIDYRQLPPQTPPGWPPVVSNKARLGRFVYSGMVDRMRKVSTHVSIGRAFKNNAKPMDAWFVLCRMY